MSPSVFWSDRVNSSNAAAPIGSSPAVGSSRNSSSGSSASARARPARLRMPPESSDGYLGPSVGGKPAHHDLVGCDLVEQRAVDRGIEFLDRDLDILGDGQRREQRAALEQDAPALADIDRLGLVAPDRRFAEHEDLARERGLEPDDRAHQHRFAGARSADHAEDLAAPHVEIEAVVDDLVAERVAQPPHRDDDLAFGSVRAHIQPTWLKNTAKKASSTITRKIAWTTAVVVRWPDLLGVALDQHALEAARDRDDHAEHRRLDQPDPQIGHRHYVADALR